jgi:hypothetical protein
MIDGNEESAELLNDAICNGSGFAPSGTGARMLVAGVEDALVQVIGWAGADAAGGGLDLASEAARHWTSAAVALATARLNDRPRHQPFHSFFHNWRYITRSSLSRLIRLYISATRAGRK